MENEKEMIENIERYVFEENKTVTYKWLSKQHNIHVNISKKFLSTFISQTNESLSVSYLIGGTLHDGSHKILVGWQQDISDAKQTFKDVTSEHVYSVQKSIENGDLKTILFSADCSSTEECGLTQKISSIQCEESNLRDTSTVEELKRQALIATKSKPDEVVTKTSAIAKKTTVQPEKNSPSKTKVSPVSNGSKKIETISPKKAGIAAMFAAQKETKKTETKVKVEPTKSKPKGLAAFFNPSNASKKNDKLQESPKVKALSPVKDKENRKTDEEVIEEKPAEKTKDNGNIQKVDDNVKTKDNNKKAAKKSGKKRKKTKEDNVQGKKRKRIMMMSDSESSDEDGYRSPSPEQREPTPPPPVSDDEDIIPTTPQVGKNTKKKKLVEKTFLDSDGFLVTNKEYIMVSDSEEETIVTNGASSQKPSEIENPVKKEEKVKIQEPKKKASPQKAKQSSITSFFKKS